MNFKAAYLALCAAAIPPALTAAVPSTMTDLNVAAASNSPAGTDVVGATIDDFFRAISSIIRRESAKGSDIASASTISPSTTGGNYFVVTGTTTINNIAASWVGRIIILRFSAALQLTHSTSLSLPGAANITTAAGDIGVFVQDDSTPNWRCLSYDKNVVPASFASDDLIISSRLAPHDNLLITRPTVNTVTVTADKLILTDNAGRKVLRSSASVTPNITASGANGLDTGSEAGGTWYYIWVIWNGSTNAGLFSVSSSSPTMPSGYTHKGLVGVVRNSSGAPPNDFVDINQHDRHVSIPAQSALINGTSTSVASVDLTGFIPPNVWRAFLDTRIDATGTTVTIADIFSDSGGVNRVARIGQVSTSDTAKANTSSPFVLLRTSESLWYQLSSANAELDILVIGWEW